LPGLYDRLGSVYGIATGVDDFIDRIMVDPRLNANPRVDEAFLRRDLKCHGNATNDHFVAESTHNAAFSAVLVA
jgi:hypothetical protein